MTIPIKLYKLYKREFIKAPPIVFPTNRGILMIDAPIFFICPDFFRGSVLDSLFCFFVASFASAFTGSFAAAFSTAFSATFVGSFAAAFAGSFSAAFAGSFAAAFVEFLAFTFSFSEFVSELLFFIRH